MRWSLLDLIEIVCLIAVAVAVGALAGVWFGVLAGGIEGVVYVNLLDDGAPQAGDS